MDKIKTKVLKSKSSNTTISRDSKKQDKKSRSNADFQPFSLKKRGVYVEKKATKTFMTGEIDNSHKKPKVIRRPGRKRFLDNILTILSKSTTGTQFPDMPNNNKMKIKKKKLCEQSLIGDLNTMKKQPKYRSRILNEYKELEVDNVVVLQSKKEIIQTPSNYSQRSKDRESIKWSDIIATEVVKTESDITVIHAQPKPKNQTLLDHIQYSKENKEKKIEFETPNDEPVTLVANEQQKDNKLYDFFVDFLETTFNVYNAEAGTASNKSSKTAVNTSKAEIDNSKTALESHNADTTNPYISTNPDTTVEYIIDNSHNEMKNKFEYYNNEDWDDNLLAGVQNLSLTDMSQDRPLIKEFNNKGKRKLKSESFSYKKKIRTPVSRSFIYQNVSSAPKKLIKKDRKRTLLNLLKEELRIEDAYEPPKNFFESLQIMAKYKNKCQKFTHFEETAKRASDISMYDCMYKRRKVLSTTGRNSYKSVANTNKSLKSFSYKSTASSRSKSRLDTDTASQLSLEVYTYDINRPGIMKDSPQKRVAYEPVVSVVTSDSSVFDIMDDHNEFFNQW